MTLRSFLEKSPVWKAGRVLRHALYVQRFRRKVRGFRHVIWTWKGAGIGDEFLCSSLLEELHRRQIGPVCHVTSVPELFLHNPRIARLRASDFQDVVAGIQVPGLDIMRPAEWQINFPNDPDAQVPPSRHIIAELNYKAGLRGDIRLAPAIYLTDEERQEGESARDHVAIMSTGVHARHPFLNKTWSPEKFQGIVDAGKSDQRFIQLGSGSDPLLAGVQDARGASLRKVAALLSHARFFIGQVGFLMHLARAVGCRSVIVYGGREMPSQSGYTCNENLYTPVPCAPCWRENTCAYDRRCLTQIQVEDVALAMSRLESRLHDPIVDDWASI